MSFAIGVIVGALAVVFVEIVIAVITALEMDKGDRTDGDF